MTDCHQMAQSWVGTSHRPAEWLWEVPLIRTRLSAAGPVQGAQEQLSIKELCLE